MGKENYRKDKDGKLWRESELLATRARSRAKAERKAQREAAVRVETARRAKVAEREEIWREIQEEEAEKPKTNTLLDDMARRFPRRKEGC